MLPSFIHINKLTLVTLSIIASAAMSLLAEQEPVINKAVADGVIAPDSPITCTITFFNGDSISGQLINLGKDSVSIMSPDLVDPVTFSNAKIINLSFDDTGSSITKADEDIDETTLFINHRNNQAGIHGVIKGAFANLDEKFVTLRTSYAGEIKVLKKFITKMEIDSKKGYLYMGPKSLKEWNVNSINSRWKYTNRALISGNKAGNLAQDVNMPDEAIISFDLSWKDDEYITLYFFSSDHQKSKPDNYYQLSLRRGSCSVLKYTNGRQVTTPTSELRDIRGNRFGRVQPRIRRPATPKLNARYDIYISKTKGVFYIYRNGIKLDKFTDKTPEPRKFGTALHIISSNKTPIRVKNLTISKWSGQIPSDIDMEKFAKIKGKGERILLKNGDVLLGKIGQVRDGSMQIETLYTPLNIPIVRMRSIDLTANQSEEEPLMYADDIKCWFRDKGWIILKPIKIEGNILTAYHQALGENQFNLSAFKRIDLHIYDKNANARRKSDSW